MLAYIPYMDIHGSYEPMGMKMDWLFTSRVRTGYLSPSTMALQIYQPVGWFQSTVKSYCNSSKYDIVLSPKKQKKPLNPMKSHEIP